MSKYNHINSIPIESIPKEEIAQAIHEWAEGNEAMEKLLWSCYNNEIKTNGCHVGPSSYLSLTYEGENKDAFKDIFGVTLSHPGSQILINPNGGNPFSGDDWYKPTIGIGVETATEQEASDFFNIVSDTINSENSESTVDLSSIISLLDLLKDKVSGLLIRIRHKSNGEYDFSLEGSFEQGNRLEQFRELLEAAGLEYINPPEGNRKFWVFKSSNQAEFLERVNNIVETIVRNYDIKDPESVDEVASFNSKAFLMRKKCIQEGKPEKFEEWLMLKQEMMIEREREIRK